MNLELIPDTAMYEHVSLWLICSRECFHHACGPRHAVIDLACRYEKARVATSEIGECCKSVEGPCIFDQFCDPEDVHKQLVATHALARVEGRTSQTFTEWCQTFTDRLA